MLKLVHYTAAGTVMQAKTQRPCSQPHAPVTSVSSSTPKIPGWNFSAAVWIYPELKKLYKHGYGCTVSASYRIML